MADDKQHAVGNVNSCSNSSDVPQHVPRIQGVPKLLNPGPTALLQARPANLSSHQAELETTVNQSPELRLIDNIAVLRHARLATYLARDEFGLQLPSYPPNELPGMDRHYSNNIVNKTIGMSTFYSPSPKAALSLPESSPAFLSQALIPCPGFNGHKPTLFIEGEGRLETSAINKVDRRSIVECLPITPETVSGQSQAVELREQSEQAVLDVSSPSLLWPCTKSENRREETWSSAHNTGVVNVRDNEAKASRTPESLVALSLPMPGPACLPVPAERSCIKKELVPWTQPEQLQPVVVERHHGPTGIISTRDGATEGSCLEPEPPSARPPLSGFRPDRRLRWKLPELKEIGRCSVDVIELRNNGTSRIDSPRLETAITLFNPLLDLCLSLLGLEPNSRLRWKPFDVEIMKRRSTNTHIVSTRQKESSLAHLTPSLYTCYTIRACPARNLQPLGVKHGRWRYGKLPDRARLEQREVCIVRPRSEGTSRCYSPRPRMALTLFASEPAVALRAPLLYLGPLLSGLESGGRPKLKEAGRCYVYIVGSRDVQVGMSRLCSPRFEMILAPFAPEPVMVLQAAPFYSHSTDEPRDMVPVRRDADRMRVFSMIHSRAKGSYLTLEPAPARRHALSGLEPDRRILRRPPNMEKLKWHSIKVVRLGNNGMSSLYSPSPKMALTPFAHRYPCHPRELWDMLPAEQYAIKCIISTLQNEWSRALCSPDSLETSMLRGSTLSLRPASHPGPSELPRELLSLPVRSL
jgi:hypothetical protein